MYDSWDAHPRFWVSDILDYHELPDFTQFSVATFHNALWTCLDGWTCNSKFQAFFQLDLPHQSILAVSDFHPGRLQLQWQLGSLWGWSTIGALGNESNHWQRCTNNIHGIQPAKMGIMTKHRRKHVYINYIVRYSQYYNIYIYIYIYI